MFSQPIALFFGLVSLPNVNTNVVESAVLKKFISNEHDEKSLLLFPEGSSTNGKCALLK